MSAKQEELPPLIAIIGCDGSGKSTVSEEIISFASSYGSVSGAHIGKQAGTVGRNLGQLPLIGSWITRLVASKSKKVRADKKKKTPENPGLVVALVLYLFVVRRVRRFRRMLALRREGQIVVTDRYPQMDVIGAIDSTDLSTTDEGGPIVLWLARKERRHFEWMTGYRPDLIIRLSVDHETACARKPDHSPESLARKIAVIPLLKFNGAPIVDIDGTLPLSDVLTEARNAVALAARGYTASDLSEGKADQ